jgi:hypothetical protein
MVKASLVRIWQILFDLLCRDDEVSVSDLNTLSGVIQKLFTCHNNLCSMDEQCLQGERGSENKQALSDAVIFLKSFSCPTRPGGSMIIHG